MNTSEIIGPDEVFDGPHVSDECQWPAGCRATVIPGTTTCIDHATKSGLTQTIINIAEDLRLERENVRDQVETIKHLEKVRSQLIELGKESTAEIARLESYRPFQNACTFILGAGAVACFAILLVQVLHG